MIDNSIAYDILYALAARDGRQEALFGNCAALAHDAFVSSCVCDTFPEIWFEIPLLGDPWFDLHALTARDSLPAGWTPEPRDACHYPELFEWFATQQDNVRQLALSFDVSSGNIDDPAVQLLVCDKTPETTTAFFEAASMPDAAHAYRVFAGRIPEGWYACYAGAFPRRPDVNLRVECIPDPDLQKAYAADAELLRADLKRVGVDDPDPTLVSRSQIVMGMPFEAEFQFDVTPEGYAGTTVGLSARFAAPIDRDETRQSFEVEGAAGELMEQIESWGLADDRWRLFPEASFAKRLAYKGEELTLFNLPIFVKLRWRDGRPLDAKAYFMAGEQ